jgi:hypothetical protein
LAPADRRKDTKIGRDDSAAVGDGYARILAGSATDEFVKREGADEGGIDKIHSKPIRFADF